MESENGRSDPPSSAPDLEAALGANATLSPRDDLATHDVAPTTADGPRERAPSIHDVETRIEKPRARPSASSRAVDDPSSRSDAERSSSRGSLARPTPAGTISITTAAEAMHHEEVHRTRVFIRIGWLASLGGIGSIPFVDSARWIVIAFVAALVLGMLVSFGYYRMFRDPRTFGPRPLFVLGVMSTFNTHIAILFYGAFTLAPVLIVIGLHFIGRSEIEARRAIWITAAVCHAAIALALIIGVIPDPGVFATAEPLGIEGYLIGAVYVQGAYALAYYTGRTQRLMSLRSIEQLQRATRVATQRAALLDELRIDLARAQQVGAGRYTDQTIGDYVLGAVIGRGAHGEVYEAQGGGEVVAVKVLHREHLLDATLVARFLREVKATTAIESPHVVKVFATSEPEAAVPFFAMERLRGLTLADLLRRSGTLSSSDVIALVAQVGAAIDAARGAGIVHRDIKPQNLFLDGATWKLVDFGVALLNDSGTSLTAGQIVGTPHYMAPEQARGEKIDHRADLYALGVIAYRVLTGRNPFGGPDTPAILYAVVHTMPPRPSKSAALPEDADRWMAIAMAKTPEKRFATGEAMAAALVAALRGDLPVDLRTAGDRLVDAHPWQESK